MTVIDNHGYWENELILENGIWYRVFRDRTWKTAAKAKKDIVTARLSEGTNLVEQGVFRGCSRLTSVCLPGSVERIEDNAFRDCTGLKSLVIPSGVVGIGYCTFCGCYNLETVVLPDTLVSIGACAFKDCRKLASLTLPNNWQGTLSIYKDAFQGCRRLRRDVYYQLQEQIKLQLQEQIRDWL